LDRVLYRRALYDSGCERSVISRAAYDYLRGKARTPPVERKIDTIELSAWFGGKSSTNTEIGVLMKFGKRRRIVWLLLVECFDYELVIGNDIFRNVFEAGIAPGDQQRILWPTAATTSTRPSTIACPTRSSQIPLATCAYRCTSLGTRRSAPAA
jgi:hypothetical protein